MFCCYAILGKFPRKTIFTRVIFGHSVQHRFAQQSLVAVLNPPVLVRVITQIIAKFVPLAGVICALYLIENLNAGEYVFGAISNVVRHQCARQIMFATVFAVGNFSP